MLIYNNFILYIFLKLLTPIYEIIKDNKKYNDLTSLRFIIFLWNFIFFIYFFFCFPNNPQFSYFIIIKYFNIYIHKSCEGSLFNLFKNKPKINKKYIYIAEIQVKLNFHKFIFYVFIECL